MAVACVPDIVEDERGFTTAGDDHRFDPKSPERRNRRRWTFGNKKRNRHLKALSMPVAPSDLNLEETLKAKQSFLSPVASGDESNSSTSNSPSGSGKKKKDRLYLAPKDSESDSIDDAQQRSRRSSMFSSLMGRFRTTSNASSVEANDFHTVTRVKDLLRELQKEGADPNDSFLLHTILSKKCKTERKRRKLLIAALTYSNADVNLRDPEGKTALHRAVEDHDLGCMKILIAFGANVNASDQRSRTPLDLLGADLTDMESGLRIAPMTQIAPTLPLRQQLQIYENSSRSASRSDIIELIRTTGGVVSEHVREVPSIQPFPQVPSTSRTPLDGKQCSEVLQWTSELTTQYSQLKCNIRERFCNTSRAGETQSLTSEEAVPLALQLSEMEKFKQAGSRILCLDGGGIRGLIQLELLGQLEKKTGRKITELFDWIIGTSTGGIIALGLVYAKKSIGQLRQLYFRMKDEIFGKVRHGGMSYNTVGLEKLLREQFTEHMCMDDVTYPRVLVSAVKKDHINLKLCFFNNCFGDDFCKHQRVWKVARYTSAAPVLFGESDGYVDGGVLANNPSESGLTKIHSYYRSKGKKLPISLVVSVGCGKYPKKDLGSADVFSGAEAWLDVRNVRDRTTNFMSLLTYALVEPSIADSNCKSRCEEQDISYFRLNPRLEQVVGSGETDMQILITMIIQANKEMNERNEMSDLVLHFHRLSEAARKMHAQINGEEHDTDTSTVIDGSKSETPSGEFN